MKSDIQSKVLGDGELLHEEYLMYRIKTMEKNCKYGFCDGNGIVPALESLDGHHSKGTITCPCRTDKTRLELFDILIKAGNMELYKRCQIDTFKPRTEWQQKALDLITVAPDSYYFMGPMGTGKTHLLAALVNREIAQGRPAALITVPQLITTIGSSKDAITELERLCYSIPYLALDDLGKEMVTGYMAAKVKGVLFRIIDRRNLLFHNKQGHTSFSSQYPRDPIMIPANSDEPEGAMIKGADSLIDRMDGATVDRIRDITIKVLLKGDSQRKGRN